MEIGEVRRRKRHKDDVKNVRVFKQTKVSAIYFINTLLS